jgi:formate-dependent nitrite reductase cytochrome c552 subunit
MNVETKKNAVLLTLPMAFVALAAAFATNLVGHQVSLKPIPLVDTNFLSTATVRQAYPDLVRAGADLSDFDCYACHEKGKPPTLHYDAEGKLIIPKEHSDIVMGHGRHGRNNNCFNCHNETDLTLLQTRDGRKVTFSNSQLLCGSCHGPTYQDWEAGAHGRTSGYWDRSLGPIDRKICANCHNPHSPHFPGRKPAPGPHLLHPVATASVAPQSNH